MFKNDFKRIGIACGPHKTEYQICVKKYDKIEKDFPKECFMNKNTLELISTCIFSSSYNCW